MEKQFEVGRRYLVKLGKEEPREFEVVGFGANADQTNKTCMIFLRSWRRGHPQVTMHFTSTVRSSIVERPPGEAGTETGLEEFEVTVRVMARDKVDAATRSSYEGDVISVVGADG